MRACRTAVLTAIFLILGTPIFAQRAGCELLTTDGVADTTSTRSDTEIAYSHRRWFCDKQFSTQGEAESYQLNGAFPFKGVPVKLGFKADRDNWSTWTRDVCSDESTSLWTRDTFVQDIKRLNVELAKVIKDCILNDKGLFVWIERTSDTKFKLAARFDTPTPGLQKARLSFSLDPDVSCEGALKSFPLNTPNEHRWLCRRKKDRYGKFTTGAAQIVANSPDIQPKWGSSLTLPAVYDPPPRSVARGKFPLYVTAPMLKDCLTRGGGPGSDLCAGRDVTLAGVYLDRGVIRTQTPEINGSHAEVWFDMPEGAHRLLFSVGNPYLGGDCNDRTKTGMRMYVYIDDVKKWETQVVWGGHAFSGELPLPSGTKRIKLVGETSDGTVNCDDSAWAQVRFDE